VKRTALIILVPPLISLGLVAGIVAEQRTHLKPEDVEPYHLRAAEAVESVPYRIGMWWIGRDEVIIKEAVTLLRPNSIINRRYVDTEPGNGNRTASLLIVQTKDSRDMLGHYPPVCYPAHGQTSVGQESMPLTISRPASASASAFGGPAAEETDLQINGIEYIFSHTINDQTYRTAVYNFLIVPGTGTVPDMRSVKQAAKNYQKRFYGAAQFQVLVSGDMPQDQRRAVFEEFVGANLSIIETLMSGGMQQ
jgi:hypothetical protein